ncbi:MAG TPA: sigma-E processing peptidase SpoIIGA [Clostridiales bacterium]|nr:sigma-E processing peptidase SpoIIGA [Clostridiales bacterium]HPV01622.1 sigma-E processing peptidase SpoIIGA [Clostridiales bacterium]
MEIYLDIVILENIVINYLILLVTSRFSKNRTSSLRLFIGSVAGTAYLVLMILLPDTQVYATLFSKFLLSVAMVAIAFNFRKISAFLKTLALFYATTFIFAGAAFALMFFSKDWGIVRNGVLITPLTFIDAKLTELLLAVAVALIIFRVVWDTVQSKFVKEKLLVDISIAVENKSIELSALVDTGNSLHDPLTNLPVVVVEFSAIRDLLPDDIKSIFERNCENDLDSVTATISSSDWFSRFRLIPFKSLGRENGMMIGFRPDYIEIGADDGKKDIRDVIVGIYNRTLSANDQYRALMNPELI